MKNRVLLVVASAIMPWLTTMSLAIAGDIPLEQLVGEYSDSHSYDGITSEPSVSLDKTRKLSVEMGKKIYSAVVDDGMLVLNNKEIVIGPDGKHTAVPTRFYITRWDQRIYLIRPEQMLGFINEINAGIEPLSNSSPKLSFLCGHNANLKWGDWDKKVTGDPEIPEKFKKFLLHEPVMGKLTQLTSDGKVWVNLGSSSGVIPGMWLTGHIPTEKHPEHKGRREFQIKVLTVKEDRCLTECQEFGVEKLLEPGWAVSSRRWD